MRITLNQVIVFVLSFVAIIIFFNFVNNSLSNQETKIIKNFEIYNLSNSQHIMRYSFELNSKAMYSMKINVSNNITIIENNKYKDSYLLDIKLCQSGIYFINITFCDIYNTCEEKSFNFTTSVADPTIC